MRSTGIIRRVDDLGRIVIPKVMREQLNIREGEAMEISIDTTTREVLFSPIKQTIDVPLSYYIDTHNTTLNVEDKAALQRLERFAEEHHLNIKVGEKNF